MSRYLDALTEAMALCAQRSNAIFMGQAVAVAGTAMRNTLTGIPGEKLLELPVAEDMQMGMATGMALAGMLPVCIYPRINFLLLAVNQLVLHLDKLPFECFGNGYHPKVIIRTAIATSVPLDPGIQHLGDFSRPLRGMLQTVRVIPLNTPGEIIRGYKDALDSRFSTILIEHAGAYGT